MKIILRNVNLGQGSLTLKVKQYRALISENFNVGDMYMIRHKSNSMSKEDIKIYQLKKIIPKLNVLIMKQVDGQEGVMFTLSKNDCKFYDIKYVPGLQVFSSEIGWVPCKNNLI